MSEPRKLCECGCGEPTPIAKTDDQLEEGALTDARRGIIADELREAPSEVVPEFRPSPFWDLDTNNWQGYGKKALRQAATEMQEEIWRLQREVRRERTWRYEAVAYEREHGRVPLADLLSACKQWRQATESRLRLTGSRGEAVPLKADQALFDAIDRAEGK